MLLANVVVALLILLVLGIVIMAITSIFLHAPYVPTPWGVCEKMVNLANLQGKEVVYDLGAGDGRLLICAKRAKPGIIARGFELALPVYLWGRLVIWKSKKDVDLQMKNFMHQDLSDADCVFLYLMPGVMKSLEKKFAKELKPGTTVISHAFYFQGRTPIKTEPVEWLSGQKDLHVYEW